MMHACVVNMMEVLRCLLLLLAATRPGSELDGKGMITVQEPSAVHAAAQVGALLVC